ncbi:hypothetical protein CSA56_16930 [candidate division KSB3 bacterium]|uniref:UspA domain-containing protein n=1 Tax=candidate division KSB3 bacterium TaxID=2044937 RepID=A0A2G6KAC1_9BACT|nr:MAG: hypothetical protein CSA56_16930 [candidate division KSB3 bacterium]
MNPLSYHSSLQDVRHSRYLADLNRIALYIKERASFLLLYDELFTQLCARRSEKRIQQKIPLDSIVGAIQQYTDFTSNFLRKHAYRQKRWTTAEIAMNGIKNDIPPIDVYQIGEVYIIADGNRRASIARQFGATMIEANITPLTSPDPPRDGVSPDEFILLVEQTDFLTRTGLATHPVFEGFQLTVPGKYSLFDDQIAVYQEVMRAKDALAIPYTDAAIGWYKNLYLPLVAMIDQLEILRDFPWRTAGDLYLWVSEQRFFIRRLSIRYHEASTTEMWDAISPSLDTPSDETDLQKEYAAFLELTDLRTLRPEADLQLTAPGTYHVLEEHIRVHRYFMGLEQKREIPYHKAVKHWYDSVYLPIVQMIQQQHLQEDFPAHTLSDLYLWISEFQFIARQEDAAVAELYLAEMWAHLDNLPYVDVEELLIKIEMIDFLLYTHLIELRPQADLTVSTPGKYRVLEKHIDVHRYFMGIEQQREISFFESVAHWYDMVYIPVLKIIEDQRMVYEFPDLTATDIYLWLSEHQSMLEKQLGAFPPTEIVAEDLITRFGSYKSSPVLHKREAAIERISQKLLDAEQVPEDRKKHDIAARRQEHLFTTILVPLNGRKDGWPVLDLALGIAKREEADISGLHVVSSEHQLDTPALFKLQQQFERRCKAAGVQSTFTVEVGHVAEKIIQHSYQADLLLLQVEAAQVSRFQDTFRPLYRHINRVLLALSAVVPSSLLSVLCVYDGSPKANEALFVSSYLAGCWNLSLIIMTTSNVEANVRSFVKNYVRRRGIEAVFVQQRGRMSECLPKVVHEHGCDVIVLGGTGYHPLLEDIFHKAFEQWGTVLQSPFLIC